uniref:(northern house mosquito) hypothetical protein n=1 Tax=Culex pipiens TaxID=7175 RepID=A0A8D8JFX3_CULPI
MTSKSSVFNRRRCSNSELNLKLKTVSFPFLLSAPNLSSIAQFDYDFRPSLNCFAVSRIVHRSENSFAPPLGKRTTFLERQPVLAIFLLRHLIHSNVHNTAP